MYFIEEEDIYFFIKKLYNKLSFAEELFYKF